VKKGMTGEREVSQWRWKKEARRAKQAYMLFGAGVGFSLVGIVIVFLRKIVFSFFCVAL
jgi:hypothetical protein